MKTDIEIAQGAKMLPIGEVAAELSILEEDLEFYGKYKAKFADSLDEKIAKNPDGKLVLVTAINPTPAGEGKTTTTVGLGQAFAKLGKKAVIACGWGRDGASGADGGFKSSFYGGFSRDHLREQFACSTA